MLTLSSQLLLPLCFHFPLPLTPHPVRTGPGLGLADVELGQALVNAEGCAGGSGCSTTRAIVARLRADHVLVVEETGIRLDLDAHIVVRLRLRVEAADVYVDGAAAAGTPLVLQLDVGAAIEGGGGGAPSIPDQTTAAAIAVAGP